jgi:hypothetical protein
MIRISSHPLSYRGSVGCVDRGQTEKWIERTVWSRVRSEAAVGNKMAKRHLNKKAVQATLDEKQNRVR